MFIAGVKSVTIDMKNKKLTLTGDIDPINVVAKLRKFCHTEIISVGPAKEEKKEDTKKDDQKKPDDKKDSTKENVIDPLKFYETYAYYYQMKPPQYNQYYYPTRCVEDDSNGCVII
ncbi:cation transporter [Escherichia coli]|nr:cation transporter [Escherichia coli]